MADDDLATNLPIMRPPDPKRVAIRPFTPADDPPKSAVGGRPLVGSRVKNSLGDGHEALQSGCCGAAAVQQEPGGHRDEHQHLGRDRLPCREDA